METVFVGDLSFFCTEEHLFTLMSAHGQVKSVIIRRGKKGENLQYGFIQMESKAAYAAVAILNGKKFLGRKLRLNIAQGPNDRSIPPDRNHLAKLLTSFISISTQTVNEEVLDRIFSKFGAVEDCTIKHYASDSETNKQTGYAFIYFLEAQDALNAIEGIKNLGAEESMGVVLDVHLSHDSAKMFEAQGLYHRHHHARSTRSPSSVAFAAAGAPSHFAAVPRRDVRAASFDGYTTSSQGRLSSLSDEEEAWNSHSTAFPVPSNLVLPQAVAALQQQHRQQMHFGYSASNAVPPVPMMPLPTHFMAPPSMNQNQSQVQHQQGPFMLPSPMIAQRQTTDGSGNSTVMYAPIFSNGHPSMMMPAGNFSHHQASSPHNLPVQFMPTRFASQQHPGMIYLPPPIAHPMMKMNPSPTSACTYPQHMQHVQAYPSPYPSPR